MRPSSEDGFFLPPERVDEDEEALKDARWYSQHLRNEHGQVSQRAKPLRSLVEQLC